MFTIKHVTYRGEYLYTGERPHYDNFLDSSEGKTLSFSLPNGEDEALTGGTVYIMNETGKTVAKYDLDNAPAQGIPAAHGAIGSGGMNAAL